MLRVLFMGTPDFAQESLKSLVEANYDVIGVVTNQDKPKGRGMKIKSRCYLRSCLWKDFTKRNFRYSEIWLYQCARIASSKI